MKRDGMESDLVENIRLGRKDAFEYLFRTYALGLIHFARRFVGSTQTAENLVQETFLAVWDKRGRLDPELSVKAYLYKAVKNRALQYLRHEKVKNRSLPELVLKTSSGSPESRLETRELEILVNRTVAGLPTKCRQVFILSRIDGLSYAEIARVQGISVKTVETQMGRALKRLRKKLAGFRAPEAGRESER